MTEFVFCSIAFLVAVVPGLVIVFLLQRENNDCH